MMLVVGELAFAVLTTATASTATAATTATVPVTAIALATLAFGMLAVGPGHRQLARRLLVAVLVGGAVGPVIGGSVIAVLALAIR